MMKSWKTKNRLAIVAVVIVGFFIIAFVCRGFIRGPFINFVANNLYRQKVHRSFTDSFTMTKELNRYFSNNETVEGASCSVNQYQYFSIDLTCRTEPHPNRATADIESISKENLLNIEYELDNFGWLKSTSEYEPRVDISYYKNYGNTYCVVALFQGSDKELYFDRFCQRDLKIFGGV